jgi:hypothetical protein
MVPAPALVNCPDRTVRTEQLSTQNFEDTFLRDSTVIPEATAADAMARRTL